jgi:hypothetical protein
MNNNNNSNKRRNYIRRPLKKPISDVAIRNTIRFVGAMQKSKELKFQQNQTGFRLNIDTSGNFGGPFFNPAQGSSQNERIGDRAVIKDFVFNIQYEYGFTTQNINPDGTAVNQTFPVGALLRVIIFVDKSHSIASIDEIIWPAVTNPEQVVSNGYDPDYAKNVTILHDKVYAMNPHASVNNVPYSFIKIKHRFRSGLEVAFDEGSTSVTTNALKYILVTNIDTAASNDAKPDCLVSVRSNFIDP